MKNLLILGFLLISIIIYCLVKYNLKEGQMNLSSVPEIDVEAYTKERCDWQKELKTKMKTTTCALDDRCDHVRLGKERKVKMGVDGKIKVEERDIEKCEGFSNINKTKTEAQVAQCDKVKSCEDRGNNCGYCDDDNPPHGLGRFMWTTRGAEGSGNETEINEVGQKARACPKNKWYYGDNAACIKARRQKLCALIKSCDDFEKYAEIIPDGICGFCPTQGKGVPIEKIGKRNVPLYQPEDTCEGGPELAKYGTLNAKQCTKFMKENPCVRPQYWTGSPDHSGECYKKLYSHPKYGTWGRDSKKDENWWKNQSKRGYFGVDRSSLSLGSKAPNNYTRWYAPIPWIIQKFKEKAATRFHGCYDKANNAWSWLTGFNLDPCKHQDDFNIPNKLCQSTRWDSLTDQTHSGHARWVLNSKLNDACEGFANREGFANSEDWLRRNMPGLLDKLEAQAWYSKKLAESKKKANIGGQVWKHFLKEIEGVMFSGKTYQMRVYATLLMKGAGHKPPPPPPMKKGDYVEYKLREHVYRGILWSKKGPDCTVMWDYYKNTSTNREELRGPSYGVCYNGTDSRPGNFNEGSCIQGVKGAAYKDRKETCKDKNGLSKSSCELPYSTKIKSKNAQKSMFGYPQHPSQRAKHGPGKLLGNYPRGIIKDVYLRVIKRCKPTSEGCSPTDYNCEDAMVIANKIYKKPQDCYWHMSGYSPCSKKCDGGWQYRDYHTILPAKGPDADKCPIGPNTKGYHQRVGWRRCNTQLCHENKYRKIKIRWCGRNGDEKDCLDRDTLFTNNRSCLGVGARGRGPTQAGGGGIVHQGTKGDEIQRGSCDEGGVKHHWRDSAGEHLKDGAYFYLEPKHDRPDVYTFKFWSPNSWSKVAQNAKRAGLKNPKGGEGLCLHPNVNTVEVADGRVIGSTYRGQSYTFRWGRDQGYLRGPTNARNHNSGWKGGRCKWRPRGRFGEMYGPWIRWNRYGLNVTHVAKFGKNSHIAYVRDGRYGKMCRFNNQGKYIWGSGRYITVQRRRWNWRRFRSETYYLSPRNTWELISWYTWGRRAGSGYRFRKGRSFYCGYGRRYNKGDEWDGLGGLGSCNSKYAELKMEKTGKGNFRLKRENFGNLSKEQKENPPKESIWDSIINFFNDKNKKKCGYTKKDGKLKEGLHWVTIGSKRSQTPGRGYYMGEPSRGYHDATKDRLYANDRGSVHRIHCDYSNRAEKRVGIYKCKGGAMDGKEYPFLSGTVSCDDKDGLSALQMSDPDLHCKLDDCEKSGGKCTGPYRSLIYHQIRAHPYQTTVHARNHRWWWSNAKSLLGHKQRAPTGQVIGGGYSNWKHRARDVPHIYTKMVHVHYYARDQGWGNTTGWVRLVLWSGHRIIYNRDVGGRGCSWSRNAYCMHRNWSWNNTFIPYWEFSTKRPEIITKALLVVREMGSGHQAWIKNAIIEFNKEAQPRGGRRTYKYVGKTGECYGAEVIKYANKHQNPGSWSQKVGRCFNACKNTRINGQLAKGFLVYPHGYYAGRCWCEPQDSRTCRWANNAYRRFDYYG